MSTPVVERKLRAVVVDDNPATLYSTGRILEADNYEVVRCARGADALRVIDASCDVAILDINLPDIDGIEICRLLREHIDTRRMAIIHLSASKIGESDRVEGLDAGADAYLTHPVHPQVLLATARALVRARDAESARQRSERKFEKIFERASCGIALLDPGLRFSDANPAMQQLFASSRAELVGRPLLEFVVDARAEEIEARLRDDSPWTDVIRVMLPSDESIELELNISPRFENGQCLLIANDVTERKHKEAVREYRLEIERARRTEAERDARAKDEFLATLSHELRNPLAPMRNALMVLEMSRPDSEAALRSREILSRQVAHMTRLVDDLMDASRITRGLIELNRRLVPLRSIIDAALEASMPRIAAANHVFQRRDEADDVEVNADAVRLAQVFMNILNNAAKYTPNGGRIELATRRVPGGVQVTVQDNGIGIAPGMFEQIFDMFAQVNPTGPIAAGGLGIGLTLVRRLTELHGGRVDVTSEGPGMGTRFDVTLPAEFSLQDDGSSR